MSRRRKKKYEWESEQAMAAHVVAWLRHNGWEVFQEVNNIDIVARRVDGFIWAIECKRSYGLDVLAQAFDRMGVADAVSVAVPGEARSKRYWFGRAVAREFGIGVIEVVSPASRFDDDLLARVVVPALPVDPAQHDTNSRSRLQQVLTPEALEAGNHAGQASGGGWTPFKQTVQRLCAFVASNPRPTLKDCVSSIEHHYSSNSSASRSLSRLIGGPAIPSLRLVYDRSARAHFIEEVDRGS